ncbi:MAG: DUF4166 domain-containing protein [Ktedonobacterales bacterium]
MRSIYEQALGSDFQRLHPQIQRRFGLTSAGGLAAIGSGTMERIWHGAFYTLPFLYIGTWRRIMFPEHGRNVPFTIENYAFVDDAGRETVTWVRTFKTRKTRRFDAYMVYNQRRGRIVDYLGSHEHLAVDLDLAVDERGGLRLRSGAQRLYEGIIGFSFPLLFSGIADVCEWYDDGDQRYHIDVNVHNRTWGPLFGYRGAFEVEWRQVEPNTLPAHLRPMRTERRD